MALRVSLTTCSRRIRTAHRQSVRLCVHHRKLTSRSSAQRCAATCSWASSAHSKSAASSLTQMMSSAPHPSCRRRTTRSSQSQATQLSRPRCRGPTHHQHTPHVSATSHTRRTGLCSNDHDSHCCPKEAGWFVVCCVCNSFSRPIIGCLCNPVISVIELHSLCTNRWCVERNRNYDL